ncbi:MAG: nicotianamine synthase family protein [Euryarchaeota archaeon]|jgi:protein-L-isoaspartate O-methyltransferase|nr:nicotianamine synthase family protein [Euryarchaeota archaeon]
MSCYQYWDKIKAIAKSLKQYQDTRFQDLLPQEIIPLLDQVEEIAHDRVIDFDSARHILDDEKMNQALQIIRRFYVEMGSQLETAKAQEILESPDPWATLESFHFYPRYQVLVENENKLVKFSPEQKVAFIGGGPLPLTVILLNKLYGARCVSIEVLPTVAQLSRQVIQKLGMESQIQVLEGDENAVKEVDYTVVMVAALAEPKERVFSNLWEALDLNTPVIYRTYTGMRAILYSPVTEKATRGFHKEVMILPSGKVNNTSVLIRKVI